MLNTYPTREDKMKRIIAILALFVLVLSCGMTGKNVDAATLDQEAKVSEEVYNLLLERAGFASYIYMDTPVSMNPENVSTFIIEEQYDDFFIGKLSSQTNTNKILVTKDGLVVAFTPKEYAHTTFQNNRHFTEVQTTVKIFVGPTIQEANYMNFASLKSNKVTSIYASARQQLTIPSNVIINHIGYSADNTTSFYPAHYGTILPTSLQPGFTHEIQWYGRYIDDILVYNKSPDAMNIFYTGNELITAEIESFSRTLDLTNHFVIEDQEQPPVNQLQSLQIVPSTMRMIAGESQTMTVNGTYTNGTSKKIDNADIAWSSTNSKVANFTNGKLVALAPGHTRVSATYDGKVATVAIQVIQGDFQELTHKLNVSPNKGWIINFSAPVDLSTVTNNNIYVTDEQGNKISAYHSLVNNKAIRIIPDENYKAGKTYTVWVKDLKSTAGQTLQQNTKMEFTIRK